MSKDGGYSTDYSEKKNDNDADETARKRKTRKAAGGLRTMMVAKRIADSEDTTNDLNEKDMRCTHKHKI